jgi:hypothetical protein
MKRWRGVALFWGILWVMGPQVAGAHPFALDDLKPSSRSIRTVEGRFRQLAQRDEATRSLDLNKGVGPNERDGHTQYWGGPYWGYGARFGHPCEACREECGVGKKTPACERCRMRCGWSDGIGR